MGGKIAKVPVILQMEALECGAASLAMILAFYKKFVPLERLRLECSVSRDGSNARDILVAARHNGLNGKGYSFSVEKLKEKCSFPAIIHWNFSHFVVLCGFTKTSAVINDPARGTVRIPLDEFDKSFTGIVLMFEKGAAFIADGEPKRITEFLLTRVKGSVIALIFVVISGFLLAITEIIKPFFTKIFTDKILFASESRWMAPIVLGMCITLVIAFVLSGLQSYYLIKIRGRLSVRSSQLFMWHVLRLPVEFFSQRFAGDISERQNSNNELSNLLCVDLAPVAISVVMAGLYFGVLLYFDVGMALIGGIVAVINIVFMNSVSKMNENSNKSMMRDAGKLAGVAVSGVEMIETIKASGAEQGFFEKWAGYQTKFNNSQNKITVTNSMAGIFPAMMQQFANLAILLIGAYYILVGRFTVGTLMAFQGFVAAFLSPVNQMVDVGQKMQTVKGKMERIEDVMNYKPDVELDFSEPLQPDFESRQFFKLEGNLEMKSISFGYSPLSKALIEDFSLSVACGRQVALVGGSGSGKSTLAKLIAGLHQVRTGEILYDGLQKEQIDRHVFTGSVAVVDQSISLFEGNIAQNISMWDESMEMKTITEACINACIHDDIMLKDEGYGAAVVEGGKNFSGGQRQRLEIARALAVNPTIIILDEATSALDPSTEKNIMDNIKKLGITCVIIAHRLSTIRDADEIIMLEYGRVVERGTHEQLVELDGKYKSLIKNE